MELIVIGVGIFVLAIVVIELLRFAFRNMRSAQRAQIRKRLRRFTYVEGGRDGTEIYQEADIQRYPLAECDSGAGAVCCAD